MDARLHWAGVHNKMATLNEHTSVLAAILSDPCDQFYLHRPTVSERLSTTNKKEWQTERFKTHKTPNEISLFTNTSHVTKAAGINFLIPNNESALAGTSRLVKDHSQKSGSLQERPLLNSPQKMCLFDHMNSILT